MRVLIDLNVVLDVVQRREPHYADSAKVLGKAAEGEIQAVLPGHALPTLYYVVTNFADRERATSLVDWLLSRFEIVGETREVFLHARTLDFRDFEDAVVAAAARQAGCERIVTRNLRHFRSSPVPAVTPRELSAELDSEGHA